MPFYYFQKLFWTLLCLSIFLQPGNALPDTQFRNFIISIPQNEQKLGKIIIDLLETHTPPLEQFFEISITDTIRVKILSGKKELAAYQKTGLPTWAAAAYLANAKTMIVKSPAWAGSLQRLETQFVHELIHAFVDAKFGKKKIPRWYNEGLAEYLSGQRLNLVNALKLANARATGQLPGFDEIENVNNFPESRAHLAYLESLSAIMYLQAQIGETNWANFHNRICEFGWETALHEFLGTDDIGFEVEWYKYVERNYRWLVVLNLDNLLWLAAVLVVLCGFFLMRLRNRRKLRRWEKEDRLNRQLPKPDETEEKTDTGNHAENLPNDD